MSYPMFQMYYTEKSIDRMTITPEIARFLLDNHNNCNRKIKESTIAKYARDMTMAAWKYNGERIIFDRNGNLVSGQHRLLACIASGVSFETDVKFGISPDSRDTVDTGASRSAADVISLVTGDKNAALKVRTANAIKKILNPHRDALSAALAEAIMEDFGAGLNTVASSVKGKSLFARAPCAGAFALAAAAYPNRTKDLLSALLDGQTTNQTQKTLHSYVLSNFGNDSEDKISSKVLYGIHSIFVGETNLKRLQSAKGAKEEGVQYFLDAIKKKKTLASLQYFAPKRA